MLTFVKYCHSKWLYHFMLPPVTNLCCCSTFFTTFGVVGVPHFNHPNRCVLTVHGSHLHFHDDILCRAFFDIPIVYLHIFFDEMSVKVFDSNFNWAFVFPLLSFKSHLDILHNSPLSDVSFGNIFTWSTIGLLILSILCFAEQKLLISMQSNLTILSFWIMPLVSYLKKIVPSKKFSNPRWFWLFLMLSFRNFTFRFVIHFELIFMLTVKYMYRCFVQECPIVSALFIEKTIFTLLSKICRLYLCGSMPGLPILFH